MRTEQEKATFSVYGMRAKYRVVRTGYPVGAEKYLTVTRFDADEYGDIIHVDLGTFSLEQFCDWAEENNLVQVGGTFTFGRNSAWEYNPRDW